MTSKIPVLIILAMWLISGCNARSLSTLQADFNDTVSAEQECPAGSDGNAISVDNFPCLPDYDVVFADIATQTKDVLSDYKGSAQIEIALHRLHAYALWQSGATEQEVVVAARQGIDKCASVEASSTPRDCALLMTVGNFVVAENIGRQIADIESKLKPAQTRPQVCNDNAIEWNATVTFMMRDAYLPMVDDAVRVASNASTPTSVLQYLDAQLLQTSDQLIRLRNTSRQCAADSDAQQTLRDCPCYIDGRTAAEQASCQQVTGDSVLQFSHGAKCIAKDALQSEKCPCGYQEPDTPPVTGDSAFNTFKVCQHLKRHSQAQKLYAAKCKIKDAISRTAAN